MASEIKVDTVSEKTSGSGVTIDGLLIKDGGISGDVSLIGTTPTFTIGDAGAEDAALVFDGNAQDFYIALDDSADDLLIGKGSAVGTTPAVAIDENLQVKIVATTASTSATTGSFIAAGGAGVAADLHVGDDVTLISDSAVLGFGADKDTTLTHTDGTGLTLNSTNKLCFNDASQFVQGSSATVLSIGATDEIDLTATAVDLNGTLDVSGNSQFSGTITVGVDDTGKDVKLFGATSGAFTLYDESADSLIVRQGASGATASTDANNLVVEGSGITGISLLTAAGEDTGIYFGDNDDNDIGFINYSHNGNIMMFKTNASEAMRINSSGDVSVGSAATTAKFNVATTGVAGYFHNTNASYSGQNLQSAVNRFTADNSYRYFYCVNSDNVKMQVIDSGAVQNAPNSYGGISDERTKQDITDASSQWEDIKALKVRKYKLKCDVALDGENAKSQIGVVSQELEASGMSGLVLENDSTAQDVKLHSDFGTLEDGTADNGAEPIKDDDGNITGYEKLFTQGKKVKAVKYSVLYMKAIKALQEAQTRIETLESKVTALEG